MKTTHVGSLPFLSLTEALDYTFQWDVPVLFTLPQMDPTQFMGKDLFQMLGFDLKEKEDHLKLDKNFYQTKIKLMPNHLQDFLNFRDKKKSKDKFKYQLIGPITLYNMLSNKEKIDFSELEAFLIELYRDLVEGLSSYGEFIFVIDEPLLNSDLSFYERESFLGPLLEVCNEAYIHCCDKIEYSKLARSKKYLHLDTSLHPELLESGKFVSDFIGVNIMSPGLIKKISKQKLKYISPSCGLGLSKPEDVFNFPELFFNLKSEI